jgi:tyrosyl-tRNA synthetase
MTLFEELQWRGLVKDISDPKIIDIINEGKATFYWGTDPSADSLHIGHLSSLLVAKRLEQHGHHPILLVGGATGQIGDPRPTTERPMITKEAVSKNFESLKKQVTDLFGYEVVNNYDWSKEINFIDFLRDYGKFFNINYMLDKDIIRRRLDTGITYTEFSYMIMQALDFLHLFETKNCVLQMEGSDQWGNITAGIDLIRKKTGKEAYGFTVPLITDSTGKKLGKSEGNAIWLDKNKTSSYELYQFFLNVEDCMVIDYLKKYTFLSKEEIDKLAESTEKEPEKRLAHKTLAKEIVTFLHGEEAYEEAINITNSLFSGNIKNLSSKEIMQAFKGLEAYEIAEAKNIIDLLVESKICSSKREAREFVQNGSIYINGEKNNNLETIIDKNIAIDNKYVIIRRGKKKYFMIAFND